MFGAAFAACWLHWVQPTQQRLASPADLQRTTNSSGQIKARTWHGVRTSKEPHQSIPTSYFSALTFQAALLMLVRPSPPSPHARAHTYSPINSQPENLHAFPSMSTSSCRTTPRASDARDDLRVPELGDAPHAAHLAKPVAPRVPCARQGAAAVLPPQLHRQLPRSRQYFWDDCEMFSISFGALTGADGER
jgi:hypothetical protein